MGVAVGAPFVGVSVAPPTTICTKTSSPKNCPAAVCMRQLPRRSAGFGGSDHRDGNVDLRVDRYSSGKCVESRRSSVRRRRTRT
ncbi:MAG: hypothetical protein MZV63_06680 [Marinilabiliales bacterium]|nr:hypothetical protein [Marinilabiliales bacterium]